jgi:hypothetical protein
MMDSVVERAATGLGAGAVLVAELYKLLVYDAGSFFGQGAVNMDWTLSWCTNPIRISAVLGLMTSHSGWGNRQGNDDVRTGLFLNEINNLARKFHQ